MEALITWCAANLRRYDIRVAILPATGVVRVWVQADQDGRRRLPMRDSDGNKLVGEAPLGQPVTEVLESAAAGLLAALRSDLSRHQQRRAWAQLHFLEETETE